MSSSSRQRENEKNDRRRSRSRTPVRGRVDSRQQSPNRRHERVPSTHRFRTSAGEQVINTSGRKVFDDEKLKEIKVTIRENDAHTNGTPPPTQRIHRNIENPEQLVIYRREGEGSRPIFANVIVNSTPEVNEDCLTDSRKRPSDRSYARHSRSPHPAERPSIRGDDSSRDNRKSPIAGPSYKRSISSSSKSPNAKRKRSRSHSRCSDYRRDDSYRSSKRITVNKSPVPSCSFRRSRSCSLASDHRKRVSAERSPARRPPADHKRDVTPRASGHRINFSERRSSASSPRPHMSENSSYQRSSPSKRSSPRRVTPPRHRTPPSTTTSSSRRNVTDSSRHVSPRRRSSPERRASQRRENSPRHRSPSNRHSPRYDRERERDRDYERDRNRDRRHSVERNRSDRYRRSSPERRTDRRHSSERGRSDRDRHRSHQSEYDRGRDTGSNRSMDRSPSSRRARSPLHGGSTDPRRMPDVPVVPIPPYDPFYEFPGARYWIPGIPPGLAARGMVPGPYRFPPRMLPHPAGVFYQPMRPRMPFTPRSPMVRPPRPAITKLHLLQNLPCNSGEIGDCDLCDCHPRGTLAGNLHIRSQSLTFRPSDTVYCFIK